MKVLSLATVLFGTIFDFAKGHSWVECTQYTAEIQGQDYVSSNCAGFPRSWSEYGSSDFGADVGADYKPGGTGASNWCPKTIGTPDGYTTTYSDTFPMASYAAGSTVRVVWPAKNHANYECFGNIPDFGMKIMVNTAKNPSSDPTSLAGWETLYDWHEEMGKTGTTGVDGIPFTNCPNFCENTDRAVCYGDMEVKEEFFSEGSGVYTFMWYWAFNGDEDLYTMCWEAYVDVDAESTDIEDGDTGSSSSSSDDDDGGNSAEYLVQIPICYKGANYEKDVLLTAASTLFSNLEWAVVGPLEEGDMEFNNTLQTHTYAEPANITEAASNDDHLFCDEIKILFGDDGTHSCSSCYDVEVYTDSVSNTQHGSGGSALTAVIIVLIIVILIIAAGIAYQKLQDKKKPNGNTAGASSNEHGMATHIQAQTNTTQAISPVQETR